MDATDGHTDIFHCGRNRWTYADIVCRGRNLDGLKLTLYIVDATDELILTLYIVNGADGLVLTLYIMDVLDVLILILYIVERMDLY